MRGSRAFGPTASALHEDARRRNYSIDVHVLVAPHFGVMTKPQVVKSVSENVIVTQTRVATALPPSRGRFRCTSPLDAEEKNLDVERLSEESQNTHCDESQVQPGSVGALPQRHPTGNDTYA